MMKLTCHENFHKFNHEIVPLFMKILFFAFPLFLGVVKHWYSYVLNMMLILSLFFCGWDWSLLDKRERKVLLGLVAFILLSSLSLINAQDLSEGLRWLKRIFYLLTPIPILLFLRRYRINPVMPFLKGVLAASLVFASVATYQVWGQSSVRAHGYVNPVLFGQLSVHYALLGSALFFVFGARHWKWYLVGGGFSFAALLAAILSQSRGPLLTVFPVLLLMLVLYRGSVTWRRGASVLLLFALLAGGLFPLSGDRVTSRFYQGGDDFVAYFSEGRDDTSVGYRFQMWQVALDMFREQPLIGSGLADFNTDLREALLDGDMSLREDHPHAHSIFFSALGTSGILGFGGMVFGVILLPFSLFYDYWRRSTSPEEQLSALGGMLTVVSFACFGLTEVWLGVSFLVTLYALCLLVFMAGCNDGESQWQQTR